MQKDAFIEALAKEGFTELVAVEREPNGGLGMHAHPFEAKALILDGGIRIGSGETAGFVQGHREVSRIPD